LLGSPDRKALDIKTSAGEQASNTGQYTCLILDDNGESMFHGEKFGK
jgi:hypothetical protein